MFVSGHITLFTKIIISYFLIDMSLFPLAPAEFDEMNAIHEKKPPKNKTLRKQQSKPQSKSPAVALLIDKIHNNTVNPSNPTNDDDGDMADFTPPPPPKSASSERLSDPGGDEPSTYPIDDADTSADNFVSLDTFENIQSGQVTDYYRNNVPYFTSMSETPIANPTELMRKMDKILHLLEEQQDHKTGHVTEELILYSFVGVFVIFIVDSFARAGKYVR
jgi:hypothetical protein